jgi:hypothetical protein
MNVPAVLERALSDYVGSPLWVLIDAAGLPEGRSGIDETKFVSLECLFTGDLAVELADVAPYLGQLAQIDEHSAALLQQLMSIDCALVLQAGDQNLTFSQAHRHLRKFNVVYGPDNKPLFFRYYDPRVLPGVLSVFDASQLQAFFGPFDAIVLREGDSGLSKLRVVSGELHSIAVAA